MINILKQSICVFLLFSANVGWSCSKVKPEAKVGLLVVKSLPKYVRVSPPVDAEEIVVNAKIEVDENGKVIHASIIDIKPSITDTNHILDAIKQASFKMGPAGSHEFEFTFETMQMGF